MIAGSTVSLNTAVRLVGVGQLAIGLAGEGGLALSMMMEAVGNSGGAPNAAQSVAATAARGFNNLECEQCAQKIQAALQKAGHKGQVIEIRGGADFIVSKSLPKTARAISENGRHIGVRVGDTVFDNLHPNGIPFTRWINEFDSLGGIRIHSITEF